MRGEVRRTAGLWFRLLGLAILLVLNVSLQGCVPSSTLTTATPAPTAQPRESATDTPTHKPTVTPTHYSFTLEEEVVDVIWEEDGSLTLAYKFVFTNDPLGAPIDFVDVSIPSENYELGSISAEVDGQSVVHIAPSSYLEGAVELGLGINAIQPGETGQVDVRIPQIHDVLYLDPSDERYTIAAFYTTWFDPEFIHGTTDMTVTLHLPDGVELGELRHLQASPGWPTEPVADVDGQGRITYTWNNPAANGIETYLFDMSFPKDHISETAIVRHLQLFTLYAWAYANRGNDFSELGDQDRAIADYDQAIELNPMYVRAYTLRGIAYSEQGDLVRAMEDYNRSLDLDPEYPWAYLNRGLAYYEQGDYDRAMADYDRAIELDPQFVGAYNARGIAYDDQGDLDRALADYTKAIELDPQLAGLYFNRALTYEEMGEVELAAADFTRFLDLSDDPNWRSRAETHLRKLQRDDTVCEALQRDLVADWVYGETGNGPGQFNHPTDVAINQAGEIYVADSLNHRVQHLNPDGEILHIWGEYSSIAEGPATGGTFNEPWGVAVAPDGSVYVADTWNHRVQHFTPTGEFLGMFGSFGSGEELTDMWGPRDVAIDPLGRVYVTDTGFKRIDLFNSEGNPLDVLSQGPGSDEGELDEPVGIALSDEGEVFVADSWNQRVQIFSSEGQFLDQWPVAGWYGVSLDNKPYLALDSKGTVFVTDPEGYRVMAFSEGGELLYCFGEEGTDSSSFGLPFGLTYDDESGLYVVDAGNDRLMHFTLED